MYIFFFHIFSFIINMTGEEGGGEREERNEGQKKKRISTVI